MDFEELGLKGLLQELLLALVGFPGDIFEAPEIKEDVVDSFPSPEYCTWRVSRNVLWLESSDRTLLDDLARLGFHYACVREFVDTVRGNFPSRLSVSSVYRRALASGLSELLDVYRASVLQLEQRLRDGDAPVLTALVHHLHPFRSLLPSLHSLVYQVHRERLVGQPLVDRLHAMAAGAVGGRLGGGPLAQSAAKRLLSHCSRVTLRQITAWMVQGELVDPHREFFIQDVREGEGGRREGGRKEGGRREGGRGRKEEEQTTIATGAMNAGAIAAATLLEEDPIYYDWHRGFKLDSSCLPPFVSPECADAILFVGRAVRLLRRPTGVFAGIQLLLPRHADRFAAALQSLDPEGTEGGEGDGGELKGMAAAAAAAAEIDAAQLEQTVQAIYKKIASLLWHLVVVRARLMDHLQAVKDYFLLAKGDFWRSFLDESRLLMAIPPKIIGQVGSGGGGGGGSAGVGGGGGGAASNFSLSNLAPSSSSVSAFHYPSLSSSNLTTNTTATTTTTNTTTTTTTTTPSYSHAVASASLATVDLTVCFQQAALKSTANLDPLFPCFGIALLPEAVAKKHLQVSFGSQEPHLAPSYDNDWDSVVLTCQLEWPLGLILTPEALRRYNVVFGLLLRLKRAQVDLESSWTDMNIMSRVKVGNKRVPPSVTLVRLRHLHGSMSHVINNLQIFIQTDVVEVCFQDLELKIREAQDFRAAEEAHSIFLSRLIELSLLSRRTICAHVASVLGAVRELTNMVHAADQNAANLGAARAAAVATAFSRAAAALHVGLSSSRLHEAQGMGGIGRGGSAHGLRQLLLRLDYNGKFMAIAAAGGTGGFGGGSGGAGVGIGGAGLMGMPIPYSAGNRTF